MKARTPFALAFLLLPLACTDSGSDPPTNGGGEVVAEGDRSKPDVVVRAWIEAVQAGDRERALALGDDAWRERETTWDRSFTQAFFDKGIRLKSFELSDAKIEGKQAQLSVRAVLERQGEEDNEGLRFKLEQGEEGWHIVELH